MFRKLLALQGSYAIIRQHEDTVDQQRMRRRFLYLKWALIFLLFFVEVPMVSADTAQDLKAAENLFKLVNDRLNLMKEVAAYKYTRDLPTYVPGREQQLLADIRYTAEGNKLDLHTVQLFLDVQLRIAVDMQNQWRKQWIRHQFPSDHRIQDLYQEIRPELSRLTNEIVTQIAITLPILQNPDLKHELKRLANENLTAEYLTSSQKDQIFSTLMRIKRN